MQQTTLVKNNFQLTVKLHLKWEFTGFHEHKISALQNQNQWSESQSHQRIELRPSYRSICCNFSNVRKRGYIGISSLKATACDKLVTWPILNNYRNYNSSQLNTVCCWNNTWKWLVMNASNVVKIISSIKGITLNRILWYKQSLNTRLCVLRSARIIWGLIIDCVRTWPSNHLRNF